MRSRPRTDRNQDEIVKAFRDSGMAVQSLAAIGKGVPDLLVGWRGRTYLVEVKDGDLSPSRRELTSAQKEWHKKWPAPVIVATGAEDAIAQICNPRGFPL